MIFVMKSHSKVVLFRERFLGIAFLTVIQFIVGIIHAISGFALLSGSVSLASFSMIPMIYAVYTLVYGSITLIFTYLLWRGRRSGWIGTVSVSLLVIFVDVLAVFDLSNVLSVPAPKVAAIGEIPYSILVFVYLLQHHVKSKYNS